MENISEALLIKHKADQSKKLPGDLAMWFFILAELTVFAIFLLVSQ